MNIIIGAIIPPRISPNFIHPLFKGVSIFELSSPKIKKIKDMINDHNLISFEDSKGHKLIDKKTIKNNIPKLLLELFLDFILFF